MLVATFCVEGKASFMLSWESPHLLNTRFMKGCSQKWSWRAGELASSMQPGKTCLIMGAVENNEAAVRQCSLTCMILRGIDSRWLYPFDFSKQELHTQPPSKRPCTLLSIFREQLSYMSCFQFGFGDVDYVSLVATTYMP